MKQLNYILFVLLLLTSGKLIGQQKLSFQEIDRQTLAYYYDAQWDSIIELSKAAKICNIDYYYLNYRVAVAYFYKTNYFTSAHYFDKALEQNKGALKDPYFKEMYYLTLIYSMQNNAAYQLLGVLDTLADLTKINYLGKVYALGMYGWAADLMDQDLLRLNPDMEYGQTDYQQSIQLLNFGATIMLSHTTELDIRYTNAQIGMISAVENDNIFHMRNYQVTQNAINIKPRFYFNRNASLDVALGLSSINGRPYGWIDSNAMHLGYNSLSEKSFLVGLEYSYLKNKTRWGINGAFSTYSFARQIQLGASLEWFPLGNYNLYTFSQATAFSPEPAVIRPVFYQKIGFKIMSKLWLEVNGTYGDVQNLTFVRNNFSYEIPDHSYGIIGAQFIGIISPRVSIFVGAQHWWRYAIKKEFDKDNNETIQHIDYQQHNITGGLQWKF